MALLYEQESSKINGAVFEVHKRLGLGLAEKIYQQALAIEFQHRGIPFERENNMMCITAIRNSMSII